MASIASYNQTDIQYAHSIDVTRNDDYQLHCHSMYEIYYFIGGDVSYLVEGKLYRPTPHSILMMPNHVFHGVRVESEVSYDRFTLHFMPDAIPPENRTLLLSLFNSSELYYQNVDRYQLPAFFDHLTECAGMPEPLRRTAILAELQALLSHMLYMSMSSNSSTPNESNSHTISRIITFLNGHLTESITLDELSDRFFVSKHHLNKVFRKATGTTVGEYVIHKRVVSAQQLILHGQSAMQAAVASGFNDYSVFYRAYKRIVGRSPIMDKINRDIVK